MPKHDFKSITVVPDSKQFVDVILSSTQRKTPTVIHKNANIGTHRKFYIRKVKTVAQNVHDRLDIIIKEFPDVRTLHSFYAKLIEVLYGQSEYQNALSHLNKLKSKCDKIAKEHVRLIKYGDSAFRCKSLKRAALGSMVKYLRKTSTKNSFEYLENCRQHLSRLPCIDVATRTVIMCGYPNVGKSSFMNKVSRADVDVQPYSFTTKSLFVGHTDYQNLRWQFIDTPGLLDRPLDECNISESLAIAALSHLEDAALLFLIDLTGQCGYSIKEQVALLKNIKMLFANKTLVVGLNKVDVTPLNEVSTEDMQEIMAAVEDHTMLPMSTKLGEGVMEVRNAVCDALLKSRVCRKLDKVGDNLEGRLTLGVPTNPTKIDEFIPQDVLNRLKQVKILEHENPEAVKSISLFQKQKDGGKSFKFTVRDEWKIKTPEFRNVVIPEIYNGQNIADFGIIDKDLLAKMEKQIAADTAMGKFDTYVQPLPEKTRRLAKKIREVESIRKLENAERMNRGVGRKGRKLVVEEIKDEMENMGVTMPDNATGLEKAADRSRSRSAKRRKVEVSKLRKESISRCDVSRARSRSGIRDEATAQKVEKIRRKSIKKMNHGVNAKTSEADRHVAIKLPKHLNSGKRGIGKTDRR